MFARLKPYFETLIIGLAIGLAIGIAIGVRYFPRDQTKRDCAITTTQIFNELNKLPQESSSATIQIPFIKQNGQWIGY